MFYLNNKLAMELLHEELTYVIRGCIFDVQNSLGTGYDEESYHLYLEERLLDSAIPFESKVVRYIEHRDQKVHKFIADLIIDDTLVLELKNIKTAFVPANYLQIISYLKCWQKDLGLLVNFGLSRIHIERIPFTEKDRLLSEKYAFLKGVLSNDSEKYISLLRTALVTIIELFGLGYSASIYSGLLKVELSYLAISYTTHTLIPIVYSELVLRNFKLKSPIIANQIICLVVAGQTDIIADMAKLKTYLKATGLPVGVLAHFGKNKLEIIGNPLPFYVDVSFRTNPSSICNILVPYCAFFSLCVTCIIVIPSLCNSLNKFIIISP